MTADLPYAHLLKRRPEQQRSLTRVEAILDSAGDLLRDQEPENITIRDLAAGAGVPTGTVYQFFNDRDAVMQALALRFLAAMPAVLDAAVEPPSDDWQRTIDRVVDGYARMVRRHPAIRRLWLSGALDAATKSTERNADAALARRLGAALCAQAGVARGSSAQWVTLVALIDGLLRHAFADKPAGDRNALREARIAARAYAHTILHP